MRTVDDVEITHGLRVWTNDLRPATVDLNFGEPYLEGTQWWFYVLEDGRDRPVITSDTRVTTTDPHPPRGPRPRWTKWDLIGDDERTRLDAIPFKDGDGQCSQCQAPLRTEGEFARHFLIPDTRFKNLGECPSKWDA